MSHLFEKNSIALIDPPSEEQWRRIHHRMNTKNWLIQTDWSYFGVNAKLSYVKAVISTDDSGEINGIIIFALPRSINILFVAVYVVHENYRGAGLGRQLWKLMEEHTDSSRIRVIHSRDKMTPKYRASGFPVPGSNFMSISGNMADLSTALDEYLSDAKNRISPTKQIHIIPNEASIQKIIEFDKTVAQIDRSEFFDAFFTFAQGRAITKRDNGAVVAYGGTNSGFDENELKIGPLYATDFDDVLSLLRALIAVSNKTKYSVRMPINTESGQRMAEFLTIKAGAAVGATPVARSSSHPINCIDWSKVFAISGHFAAPLA